MQAIDVLVSEVGPRDGLQNTKQSGEPLYGYVPDAGVTKGFVPASRI